jgi:protein O-mannosyl-transferase
MSYPTRIFPYMIISYYVSESEEGKNTMLKLMNWIQSKYVYLLIIILGMSLYGKSIFFDYTFVDDHIILEINKEYLQHLTNIPKIFTTDFLLTIPNPYVYYRPLVNLLFMIEMQVTDNVLPLCHLTNILLHLLNSCLVYMVLLKVGISKNVSAILGIVFCVLPIHTSAVVWIPGRNDTLMTFFVLCAFICFLRYGETSHRRALYGYTILYFLALLTKEAAVVLPVLCIFWLIFSGQEKFNSRKVFGIIVCSAAVVIPWLVLRSTVQQASQQQQVVFFNDFTSTIGAMVLYFGKIFLPLNLSVTPNLQDQSLFYGIGSLCIAGFIFFIDRKEKRWNIYSFGILWFILFLVPAFLVSNVFYEFRSYCAVIGIFIFIGRLFPDRFAMKRTVSFICLGLLLAAFSVITWITEEQYRDRMSYAFNAMILAPSLDESYSIMGGAYIDQGQDSTAEQVLLSGIRKKPSMRIVHRMLGDIYAHRHQYAAAAQEYETSLRLEPSHLWTYIHYGELLLETGSSEKAAQLWKTSISINPDFILGYYYLVNYYIYTKSNSTLAMSYVNELRNRGAEIMPQLLEDLEVMKQRGK